EILAPPLVLPLLLLALWPLRGRPGVRPAMAIAVALTLFWGLKLYGGLLGPFLLALAVAYLMAPAVALLERRRIGRGTAIGLVAIPPLAALVLLLILAGPQVWAQAGALVSALPRFATTVLAFLADFRSRLEGQPFLTIEQRSWLHELDAQQLAGLLQENAQAVLGALGEWGLAFGRRLGTLLGFLGYLVVT